MPNITTNHAITYTKTVVSHARYLTHLIKVQPKNSNDYVHSVIPTLPHKSTRPE